MMTWSSKERAKYVDASHNACFYTVTNRLWYMFVACKPIAKGDTGLTQAYCFMHLWRPILFAEC